MGSIKIGNTAEYFIDGGETRKLLQTSTGKLVVFANLTPGNDTDIRYKTSDDEGSTWSSWNIVHQHASYDTWAFDTYIEDNNDILFVLNIQEATGRRIIFKRLTYGSGETWSVGSSVLIKGGVAIENAVITKRSNGDIWVGAELSNDFYAFYSTNGGANWNETTIGISMGAYNRIEIIPKDTYIWAFANISGKLTVYQYDTSWDSGTTISGSEVIGASPPSAINIDDNHIWVSCVTEDPNPSDGIYCYHFDNTVSAPSWDSGVSLSTQGITPSTCNIGGNPLVCWEDRPGSPGQNIAYRKYNGTTWETQIHVSPNSSFYDLTPSSLEEHDNSLFLIWLRYLGSPEDFDIFFEKVELPEMVIEEDIITLSDSILVSPSQENILLEDTLNLEDYLLDIRDINNDFRTHSLVLSYINNKFNSAIRVIKDIVNIFNTAYSGITNNLLNDIRSKSKARYDISNDFRLLASWQVPGDVGFESLGKEYVKVYIDDVEQTDVDIDSISITKTVNSSHTASFDLGRPYDNTKPDMELSVKIKYNDCLLYKGYITNIIPTDSPESIRITCNNKHWKENRTKKYFFVGHKPQDDKEKYYNKISEALSTELSWSPGIGDFIPQTMSCFAQGSSDCISSLITNAGNFDWFYKEDESKKLRIAGQGDIINIEAQKIGTNLGLYQVIRHQFRESIEGIINKLRVQMGEEVIRNFDEFGGTKGYSSYYYTYLATWANPDWDSFLEVSAKDSSTGYGFDWHDPSDDDKYKDVFTKYNLEYLDSRAASWSDRYDPQVKFYWSIYGFPEGEVLDKGFTIDYEKGFLILNEPYYFWQLDAYGNIRNRTRPNIKLFLSKKIYHSWTDSPTEDPESEVSNPLMFFTDKIGDYPETIFGFLGLSGLSIQEGLTYKDYEENTVVIPSWNDIDFATDYANWAVSKTCDKKINGSIDITLDATCFYNIDLSKRINIPGVTELPLNISSITYNMRDFTVTLNLERGRYYKRTISLQTHGE